MFAIRKELVKVALNRSIALIDFKVYDNFHKHHEFRQKTILDDRTLTNDEKSYAIRSLNKTYDRNKVLFNEGEERICENCYQECLATLYCERCVRNYLKENFLNWTSGNDDVDNLIQECQMETIMPERVIEWVPYDKFQNIKYLTESGYFKIYTAKWIGGRYIKWDSNQQQLKRGKTHNVILKKLENIEGASESWFEKAKTHLIISNKSPKVVQYYGLTQDPSDGNYMLIMNTMDIDLRKYLQQNHNHLTWKERIHIVVDIIAALEKIHKENAIHRDLHSGNILHSRMNQRFEISDLGFCCPTEKSPKSIYGKLPYIAPEVIAGKGYTCKSDIYSIAMLMWEISSGQPPFINHHDDDKLARNIVNGIRPEIVLGTPLKYQILMEQCWNADSFRRPDIKTLCKKIREINLHCQNIPNRSEVNNNLKTNYTRCTSKIYQFEGMPRPRNATKEEQKAYYAIKSDLDESNNQNKDTKNHHHVEIDDVFSDDDENTPRVWNRFSF